MTQQTLTPFAPAYLEGIRLFNAREFFECHDVLEELWTDTLGPEREFYQGLIQTAVALFHFGEGNFGGALRLYQSAIRYLKPYRSHYLGLDVTAFLADFENCFRDLIAAAPNWPQHVALQAELIPTIQIQAETK